MIPQGLDQALLCPAHEHLLSAQSLLINQAKLHEVIHLHARIQDCPVLDHLVHLGHRGPSPLDHPWECPYEHLTLMNHLFLAMQMKLPPSHRQTQHRQLSQ